MNALRYIQCICICFYFVYISSCMHAILIKTPIHFSRDDFRNHFISITSFPFVLIFLLTNIRSGIIYAGQKTNVFHNRRVYNTVQWNSQTLIWASFYTSWFEKSKWIYDDEHVILLLSYKNYRYLLTSPNINFNLH